MTPGPDGGSMWVSRLLMSVICSRRYPDGKMPAGPGLVTIPAEVGYS